MSFENRVCRMRIGGALPSSYGAEKEYGQQKQAYLSV